MQAACVQRSMRKWMRSVPDKTSCSAAAHSGWRGVNRLRVAFPAVCHLGLPLLVSMCWVGVAGMHRHVQGGAAVPPTLVFCCLLAMTHGMQGVFRRLESYSSNIHLKVSPRERCTGESETAGHL